MTTTRLCLLVGLVLGIVAGFGGFVPLLVAIVFGGIGLVLEGKIDLGSITGRSSSR